MEIGPELVELIESGVSMSMATRDAAGMPEPIRAAGAKVHPDRRRLTIYLPAATADLTLSNLLRNDRVAVTFSRVMDHRTFQVKGRRVALREAGPEERTIVEGYAAAFARSVGMVGMPPRLTMRFNRWPAWAVEVEVQAIFEQTPGPGAGASVGRAP